MPVKKILPPETRQLGLDTYYKVIINHKLRDSGKATLWSLKIGQVINNCKVSKVSQDVWFPNMMFFENEHYSATDKCIWVKKEHYDKMRFV